MSHHQNRVDSMECVRNENDVRVFFYGLFMDESLLEQKGFHPSHATVGRVDGHRLRIGSRATLVPGPSRVHGVLMTLRRTEVAELYSDPSVEDYVAEEVSVTLPSGAAEAALCYVLPEGKLEGANALYAAALLQLARKLGFPEEYLEAIRRELDATAGLRTRDDSRQT